MAGAFLPPLVAEIRANAAEFFATTKAVRADVDKMAAATEGGLTPAQRGFRTLAGVGKATAVALGASAAVIGYESIKMASDFQSRIELLHTAGGESQAELGAVAAGIKRIAEQTGTSVNNLADGMYILEKAGDRGAVGLGVLRAAAEGAKAENVSLSVATNALTSVMMSYHDKASQAVSVENELIRGSGLAKTTMQEYAGSLSTVIPIASAARISFAQVAGAVATLTQHGTSAQESTQELANTIRNLLRPSSVAVGAMQQIGLSAVDVSKNLGQRGLTGTIQMITNAIEQKMGPSGLVVVNAFKESQSAAADLQTMIGHMPASLAALSKGFLDGSVSLTSYRKQTRDLGATGYAMGAQFMSLAARTRAFNDLLKAGSPQAQTFAGYLSRVMGGATGLNTALMLGGENMAYFTRATKEVAAAGGQAGANVSTWAATSATLRVQLDQAGASLQVLGVDIGTWLIPKVQAALHWIEESVDWLHKHQAVAIALAGAIGGPLVLALGAFTVELGTAAAAAIAAEAPLLPLILTVAALGAGALLLATHWHTVWTHIKDWTGDAVSFLRSHLLIVLSIPVIGWLLAIALHWHTVWTHVKDWTGDAVSFLRAHFLLVMSIPVVGWMLDLALHWRTTWAVIRAVMSGAYDDVLHPLFTAIKVVGIDPIMIAVRLFADLWRAEWRIATDAVRDAWDIIQPIISAIESAVSGAESAISALSSAASTVGGVIGDLNPFSWDTGGPVPGPVGQPVFGVVHGGEFVLSHDMLTGGAAIPTPIMNAVIVGANRGITPGGSLPSVGYTGAGPAQAGMTYAPTYQVVVQGDMSADSEQRLRAMLAEHDAEIVQTLTALGVAA